MLNLSFRLEYCCSLQGAFIGCSRNTYSHWICPFQCFLYLVGCVMFYICGSACGKHGMLLHYCYIACIISASWFVHIDIYWTTHLSLPKTLIKLILALDVLWKVYHKGINKFYICFSFVDVNTVVSWYISGEISQLWPSTKCYTKWKLYRQNVLHHSWLE